MTEKLLELKEKMESRKKERDKLKWELEENMKKLKEMGCDTIELAKEKLEKIGNEVAERTEMLNEKIKKAEELLA